MFSFRAYSYDLWEMKKLADVCFLLLSVLQESSLFTLLPFIIWKYNIDGVTQCTGHVGGHSLSITLLAISH